MTGRLVTGTRVELRRTLLEPAERAPGLPAETAAVPYEVRVRGRLTAAAAIGETATVITSAGRRVEGVVEVAEPADDHTFGRPHPALLQAVSAIEAMRSADA